MPEDMNESVNKFADSLKSLNILVMGKTGVGKSTIVNSIFGEDIANTGAGFPVTQYFQKYSLEEEETIPINIYDSAGCELGKEKDFIADTYQFLEGKLKEGIDAQIHVAWYVVNASSARFEPFEGKIINKLYEQRIPVIIILSQCDCAREKEILGLKDALNSLDFEKVYNIIEVSALPLERLGIEPFGLDELISKTSGLLSKIFSDAFIARQIVDIKAKRPIPLNLTISAASACFGVGFIPLPFTTTFAAIAAQTTLWIE